MSLVFLKNMTTNVFILLTLSILLVQIDENVQREIINHRSLRHPNIVRFKEVCKAHLTVLDPLKVFFL